MELKDLAGRELGNRSVAYEERDVMLYALAVGASSDEIDLIYERDLRVLPTYVCALGLWAVEAAGGLGTYDRNKSLHAFQSLEMHTCIPASGAIETSGRIAGVWDKGSAAMIEIVVESDAFTASYGIFLPGLGGWGGERGSSAPAEAKEPGPSWSGKFETCADQAAIYRLTGDRHPIHIDPEVAHANGFQRPILHGLCTLGIAARLVAKAVNAHPADLRGLQARLAAPVLPGDSIEVFAVGGRKSLTFEARVADTVVLKGGRAVFEPTAALSPTG